MHKPIQINDLDLYFPHKICFENFKATIHYGSCIAIIGRNGSGKSCLLKILQGMFEPSGGNINIPNDAIFGYVPQIIDDFTDQSGGERLNKALTGALSLQPNILLLDEPTNHLDQKNRQSLMRKLQNYAGTLIIISHDTELLRSCIDILWHIDNGKIHIFSGDYDDYIKNLKQKYASIEQDRTKLKQQKKTMHDKRMKQQQKAAKSRSKGKKNFARSKVTKMTADLKTMKAQHSQGKKSKNIDQRSQQLQKQLDDLYLPEVITPKFFIDHSVSVNKTLIQITNGSARYTQNNPIISGINLSILNSDRTSVIGDNGSGKSTLFKAILGDKNIHKTGDWIVPNPSDIGYLDQHYSALDAHQSAFEIISNAAPHWKHGEIRRHLNDFLFRKNEEINAPIKTLSGGEKARLSLAQIAANPPSLLLLDEITNNLDLETKEHIIQVLKAYGGAMIIISHEPDFLEAIGVYEQYDLNDEQRKV